MLYDEIRGKVLEGRWWGKWDDVKVALMGEHLCVDREDAWRVSSRVSKRRSVPRYLMQANGGT